MKKMLSSSMLLCVVLLACNTSSRANLIDFTILLSGPQEADASTAAAGGIAIFNDATNTISLSVFFAGLTAPATASHIHLGPSGVAGPVILSFVPFTPPATSGSIVGSPLPFPVADVPALEAGDTYFNIHDANFPGGEIRGQLVPATQSVAAITPVLSNTLPSLINFDIGLTGTQETPPNSSTAVAGGIATFDSIANTIDLSVFFAGLTAPATASHIHLSPSGVAGPVIVSFVPFTPAATSGSIVGGPLPFPVADLAALLAGDTYFNIHDSVFPGGEIRGQLQPTVEIAPSVPEPATLVLLGIGLAGLGFSRRQRKH